MTGYEEQEQQYNDAAKQFNDAANQLEDGADSVGGNTGGSLLGWISPRYRGSNYAAEVAAQGRASAELYRTQARNAEGMATAESEDDFETFDSAQFTMERAAEAQRNTIAALNDKYSVEISAAAAFGASSALGGLAAAIDEHINAQRLAISFTQGALRGLRDRAAFLALSFPEAPAPDAAFTTLTTQRDQVLFLGAAALQTAADFFGIDMQQAGAMGALQLHMPFFTATLGALGYSAALSGALSGLGESSTQLKQFTEGKLAYFEEKYSRWGTGWLHRAGDEAVFGLGRGWQRTGMTVIGNIFGGAGDALAGLGEIGFGLAKFSYNVFSGQIFFNEDGSLKDVSQLTEYFSRENLSALKDMGVQLKDGLIGQVQAFNPANMFNDHHGDTWEQRLGGYAYTVGGVLPDIAVTIATGGVGTAVMRGKAMVGLLTHADDFATVGRLAVRQVVTGEIGLLGEGGVIRLGRDLFDNGASALNRVDNALRHVNPGEFLEGRLAHMGQRGAIGVGGDIPDLGSSAVRHLDNVPESATHPRAHTDHTPATHTGDHAPTTPRHVESTAPRHAEPTAHRPADPTHVDAPAARHAESAPAAPRHVEPATADTAARHVAPRTDPPVEPATGPANRGGEPAPPVRTSTPADAPRMPDAAPRGLDDLSNNAVRKFEQDAAQLDQHISGGLNNTTREQLALDAAADAARHGGTAADVGRIAEDMADRGILRGHIDTTPDGVVRYTPDGGGSPLHFDPETHTFKTPDVDRRIITSDDVPVDRSAGPIRPEPTPDLIDDVPIDRQMPVDDPVVPTPDQPDWDGVDGYTVRVRDSLGSVDAEGRVWIDGRQLVDRHGGPLNGRIDVWDKNGVDPLGSRTVIDDRIDKNLPRGGANRNPTYEEIYQEALRRATVNGVVDRDSVLQAAFDTVSDRMKYGKEGTDAGAAFRAIEEAVPGQKVQLSWYIEDGVGQCRHQSLTTGYILERFAEDGHLRGTIHIERNIIPTARGPEGHQWVRYETSAGESIIIDVAQKRIDYADTLAGDPDAWRYEPGDHSTAQTPSTPHAPTPLADAASAGPQRIEDFSHRAETQAVDQLHPDLEAVEASRRGHDVVGSDHNGVLPSQQDISEAVVDRKQLRLENGAPQKIIPGQMTDDGRVVLRDGHHDYVAGMRNGTPPTINVRPDLPPVKAPLDDWSSTQYAGKGHNFDWLPEDEAAAARRDLGFEDDAITGRIEPEVDPVYDPYYDPRDELFHPTMEHETYGVGPYATKSGVELPDTPSYLDELPATGRDPITGHPTDMTDSDLIGGRIGDDAPSSPRPGPTADDDLSLAEQVHQIAHAEPTQTAAPAAATPVDQYTPPRTFDETSITWDRAAQNPNVGWKMHLNIDVNDPQAVARVKAWAAEQVDAGRLSDYKVGDGGGTAFDNGSKEVTLYAGEFDNAEAVARQLEAELGDILQRPDGVVMADDLPLTEGGLVWGRFTAMHDADGLSFHQYGGKGIPYLADDMGDNLFGGGLTPDEMHTRAYGKLEETYGTNFSGTNGGLEAAMARRADVTPETFDDVFGARAGDGPDGPDDLSLAE